MEARTNLLDTVGTYRQRIEDAFAARERQGDRSGPTLRAYLQDWLADLSAGGGGGDESDPELPAANAFSNSHRRASSDRYSIKSEEDNNSMNSSGRRRSLNWIPPAHVNRGSPAPLDTFDYSMAPPPPPEMSEYHAVNLPVTISLLLKQIDPTQDKEQLIQELTSITTQNPDMDATMDAVTNYVEAKDFVFEKLDETFDKWKVARQNGAGFYLMVMRIYLLDKSFAGRSVNAHYYDHHALAYHGKVFRDHNVTSEDAFLVSSKAASTQELSEKAFDNFFRSGRYKNHATYRHCALLNTWRISLKEHAKRKLEEDCMNPAKRARISLEEWSGGAKFEAKVAEFKPGGFTPITGEYTAIPDATAIVLNRMNINTDDMPKSLNHDHWLESVKKYMRMPMTRYLNSKGMKLLSLPQGTLNNHLNILRQKEGKIVVVLSIHFMDDKHGPVPRKTHAMVWLAKERLLIDHSARDSPTCVIDRDLKSDFTAKRVFDAILQQQVQTGNRVFQGSVVRSAYEIIPMTDKDIEKYNEDMANKERLAEEKKRVAEHKARLQGLSW